MIILSHRGLGFGQPENSLRAAVAAADRGFGLELDVRLDDHSRPVMSHDPAHEPFWTLESALSFVDKRHVQVAFHLKSQEKAAWEPLASALSDRPGCFLFDPSLATARKIKRAFPKVLVALSVSEKRHGPTLYTLDEALGSPDCAIIWWDEWTHLGAVYNDDQRRLIRSAGKPVYAISPELHGATTPRHALASDPENSWRELQRMGVDGICTDYPERLASFLAQESLQR